MRLMSVALTEQAVIDQTKTVTRRTPTQTGATRKPAIRGHNTRSKEESMSGGRHRSKANCFRAVFLAAYGAVAGLWLGLVGALGVALGRIGLGK